MSTELGVGYGCQTLPAARWGKARLHYRLDALCSSRGSGGGTPKAGRCDMGGGPLRPRSNLSLYSLSLRQALVPSPPPPQLTIGISLLTTFSSAEWREFIRLAGPAPGPRGPWRLQLLQVQIHFIQIHRTAVEGCALALLQNALFSLLSQKYLSMLI